MSPFISRISVGLASATAPGRKTSEDGVYLSKGDNSTSIFGALVDGATRANGLLAKNLALEILDRLGRGCVQKLATLDSDSDFKLATTEWVETADRRLRKAGAVAAYVQFAVRPCSRKRKPGTSSREQQLYGDHGGDTRVFVFRQGAGYLEQMTLGQGGRGPRGGLANGLGHPAGVGRHPFHCDLQPGDTVLVSSDGLDKLTLQHDRVARIIVGERDAQKVAEALVKEARRARCRDDITVVVIRVGGKTLAPLGMLWRRGLDSLRQGLGRKPALSELGYPPAPLPELETQVVNPLAEIFPLKVSTLEILRKSAAARCARGPDPMACACLMALNDFQAEFPKAGWDARSRKRFEAAVRGGDGLAQATTALMLAESRGAREALDVLDSMTDLDDDCPEMIALRLDLEQRVLGPRARQTALLGKLGRAAYLIMADLSRGGWELGVRDDIH